MLNGNRALADWCELADVFCSTYLVLSAPSLFSCFFFFWQFWGTTSVRRPATWWWRQGSRPSWSASPREATRNPPSPGRETTSRSRTKMTGSRWVCVPSSFFVFKHPTRRVGTQRQQWKSRSLSDIMTRLLKIICRSPAGEAQK